jgi:hypothetical protein
MVDLIELRSGDPAVPTRDGVSEPAISSWILDITELQDIAELVGKVA